MYQESGRHAEALDAITRYLDMGTYSEWDEDKKLEFLTRELKGKRPLVPPTIEVRCLENIAVTNKSTNQNLYIFHGTIYFLSRLLSNIKENSSNVGFQLFVLLLYLWGFITLEVNDLQLMRSSFSERSWRKTLCFNSV